MTEEKPIDQIIGEGTDRGPAAQPEPVSEPRPSDAGDAPDRTEGNWTYAALKDERSKRQALAERNAELESQLQAYTQQQTTPSDQLFSNPDAVLMHFHQANMGATRLASEANARVKYGQEYEQMEAALNAAMQQGHPDLHLLREAAIQSGDPAEVVMQWYRQASGAQQQQRRGPVYPSNLAGARNVGTRSGPAWSGPTPLDDIFDRGRR